MSSGDDSRRVTDFANSIHTDPIIGIEIPRALKGIEPSRGDNQLTLQCIH
jgi:hypothetical protein